MTPNVQPPSGGSPQRQARNVPSEPHPHPCSPRLQPLDISHVRRRPSFRHARRGSDDPRDLPVHRDGCHRQGPDRTLPRAAGDLGAFRRPAHPRPPDPAPSPWPGPPHPVPGAAFLALGLAVRGDDLLLPLPALHRPRRSHGHRRHQPGSHHPWGRAVPGRKTWPQADRRRRRRADRRPDGHPTGCRGLHLVGAAAARLRAVLRHLRASPARSARRKASGPR